MKKLAALLVIALCGIATIAAQELQATVTINTQKVEGTKTSVFEDLKESATAFLNDRQWTDLQFKNTERIKCSFTIIVSEFDESSGAFSAEAYIVSQRPVFNASYTTTTLSHHDTDVDFEYHEFDQLDFRDDQIDDALTAWLAYYAYLIIGIDLDTFSPMGGTEVLQKAMDVADNAQSLSVSGWSAFDDSKNRYGIISDYLNGALEPFRQMQYTYHRKGLDYMASKPDDARAAITEALTLLGEAYTNKTQSALPRLFCEWKRDEIVGIYSGRETKAIKQPIYDTLVKINASQSSYWKKMLE